MTLSLMLSDEAAYLRDDSSDLICYSGPFTSERSIVS